MRLQWQGLPAGSTGMFRSLCLVALPLQLFGGWLKKKKLVFIHFLSFLFCFMTKILFLFQPIFLKLFLFQLGKMFSPFQCPVNYGNPGEDINRRNADAASDSVISILLHFIMPLSIISTDYMQLDLLYSFFLLSAWTDTRRFRLQIHRYMCVCFYTAWRKRAVTGITWLPRGEEGRRAAGSSSVCLSKATAQVPAPASSSGHTFKQQET